MPHPFAARSPWSQLFVLAVVLPVLIGLAVLAFAWPAGRLAPRDLPVGIVGATPASQAAVAHLVATQPGAFEFRLYATADDATAAIRHRHVYGALDFEPGGLTVFEASAASPAVAQLLGTVGTALAADATDVDVVPDPAGDPRGTVFSASLLPLTICSLVLAVVLVLVVRIRPVWRQVFGLLTLAALSGVAAYFVAQGFLGGLPGDHWATWAALSLTILALAAPTAGLIALVGPLGLVLSAVLFVF
jgi:hypothetical protein